MDSSRYARLFCVARGEWCDHRGKNSTYDFDFETGNARKIADVLFDGDKLRFNDGRADRQGRLWAGTVPLNFDNPDEMKGAFYRFDGKTPEVDIAPIIVANGTASSPDGETMYRSESMDCRIYTYDYDTATDRASNERIFASMPEGLGGPDGANIDTEGGYWVSLVGAPKGGFVARYTPDGCLDFKIEMPVLFPTMIAFGGPDMSTLYVTSARLEHLVNCPASEQSGNLFVA